MHGISAGSEGLALLTAVGSRAGGLAVDHVGGDGQNGGGGDGVPVGVVLADVLHEVVQYRRSQ